MRKWLRSVAAVMMVAMSVMLLPGISLAKPRPPVVPEPPAGISEEQANESYRASVEKGLQETGPVMQGPGIVEPDATIPIENGDIRITGPTMRWKSGKIQDEQQSGMFDVIKYIVMKVLGYVYETVASIVEVIELAFGVMHDPQVGVSAATYHEYTTVWRTAQYYKNGSWYNGASVERRTTWGMGFSSFYTTDGVPFQQFDDARGREMAYEQGCHYDEDSWLIHTATGTYLGEWSYTLETYNSCLPYTDY